MKLPRTFPILQFISFFFLSQLNVDKYRVKPEMDMVRD